MEKDWSKVEHILQLQLRVLKTLVRIEEKRLRVKTNTRIVVKSPEVNYIKSCLQELNELLPEE